MKKILSLIRKEIYQRRWSLLTYCVIAFGFVWMYIAIYPSFQKESAKFNELMEAYPKALLEAFNIEQLQLNTVEGYISAEHFSFVWPLMAILIMLSTGGQAIAGEIERGSMALLLSLPAGRLKLFVSKYISGLIILLLFVVFSILAVIPLAKFSGLSISADNVWRAAVLSLCFAWAIFSTSFMVSSMVSERSKVYFAVGGTLLLMYVANIVSGLVDKLDKLKYISAFYYYVPDKALVQGHLSTQALVVFVVAAMVTSTIGLIIFLRRDISV